MRQQAAEKVQAGGGEPLALVAGESIDAAFAVDQRLMQMPAARKTDWAAPAGT